MRLTTKPSHHSTRDFIQALGTHLQASKVPEDAVRTLVDKFARQMQHRYVEELERAAKYQRVGYKLVAQFPAVTGPKLAVHAPVLFVPSRFPASAPDVVAANETAVNILGAPQPEADRALTEARSTAQHMVAEAEAAAAEVKAKTQEALADAREAQALAAQSASGVMAEAQRQQAKAQREVAESRAELCALQLNLDKLQAAKYELLAPLRKRPTYSFTAGGCTFHVGAGALEARPESYLASLVRAEAHGMAVRKDVDGAYRIDDVTAEQLQAVCHLLNSGQAVGCLEAKDALALDLLARFGVSATFESLPATKGLDPSGVKEFCDFDSDVESQASKYAQILARQLPLYAQGDLSTTQVTCKTLELAADSGMELNTLVGRKDQWRVKDFQAAWIGVTRWLHAAAVRNVHIKPIIVSNHGSRWLNACECSVTLPTSSS